ncbi:MAG: hypothetical protein US18_C0023G0011 [Parcubacteria group bacterium GW2011_GWB1_36_5]|nr:MAG: hypothetical protein US12_C0005G0009 [Parcubacteria group bacterium GW2011_GWA2_36_24]KKQ07228.1 MAG: hypothetical protein US18_C0023G0011 [Parcubacteria group bacterium GW2011_GWB1_36_5]
MKNLLNKFLNISVDKYYRMNDAELEVEASKWKIRSYGNSNGSIERQIIINALLEKENANNSRYATMISILAILISIFSLILK